METIKHNFLRNGVLQETARSDFTTPFHFVSSSSKRCFWILLHFSIIMSPLFTKVGENPPGSSRSFREMSAVLGTCSACLGARAVEWHGQGSHSTIPERGFLRNQRQPLTSHTDLLWSCPTLQILFLSRYLYIFRGLWVEKKKGTNSRVCLSAIIVTFWLWKPSDKTFTTKFSVTTTVKLSWKRSFLRTQY